jgi:adenylosuccinate synthase
MAGVIIVGAQWGDEGKGKVVDIYTDEADYVVRYAGGPNAGHTLVVDGQKCVVRLVPSGILRRDAICVLGQGTVVDPKVLVGELETLEAKGLAPRERMRVAERAHVILSYHILVDGLREATASAIGTTKRGVGPCYEDKAARRGIRLRDFRSRADLTARVAKAIEAWSPVIVALGGQVPSVEAVVDDAWAAGQSLLPLLADTAALTEAALRDRKRVLFEGAQGTLLDVDHGTYPFVTSSSAIAGGACTGVGIGPSRIDSVVGLAKAYCTRVGGGPFPTELEGPVADRIRTVGAEFGSVTGRPRRVGWVDLPALRYAVRLNGLDSIALTKLDVLAGLETIRACVAYDTPEGRTRDFPADDLASCTPVYADFPGFSQDVSNARALSELPKEALDFVRFVETEVECPLSIVSVGPGRDQTIVLSHPLRDA